jgi:Glycosyl hydrolases family 28
VLKFKYIHFLPFQLDGTIVAPTNHKRFTSGLLQWIEFTKLNGITIQGQGIVEGRGNNWWNINSDLDSDDDPVSKFLPFLFSYFIVEIYT